MRSRHGGSDRAFDTALLLAAAGHGFRRRMAIRRHSRRPGSGGFSGGTAPGAEKLLDNLNLFVASDGSKQPQDLGINANMGVRLRPHGLPLIDRANLRRAVGAGRDLSDAAVHVLDQISTTSRRTRPTSRSACSSARATRITGAWPTTRCFRATNDKATLGQVRGQVGFDVTRSNEWVCGSQERAGRQRDAGHHGDSSSIDSQVNGYTTIRWAQQAKTTVCWAWPTAMATSCGCSPTNSRDGKVFVYGAELSMPLTTLCGDGRGQTSSRRRPPVRWTRIWRVVLPWPEERGQSRFAPP